MYANHWKHSLLLLLTATIWGFAFVAQSVAMDYIGTFTFNGIRFMMGSIVLLPYLVIREQVNRKSENKPKSTKQEQSGFKEEKDLKRQSNRYLMQAGMVCGGILCFASALQQIGIKYTAVGKAGFITAIYILIVPVLGIFMRKIPEKKIMLCVLLALVGLYLLCVKAGNFSIGKNDWVLLLSSFAFSFHILAIDYFGKRVDGIKLSCLQFLVCGVISLILMFFTERPDIGQIILAWKPLLYAGVLSCGIAYTLQVVGQRGMNPTIASLIMSLESVVSVLAGWLILHQNLSKREYGGCMLVFFAILIAQVPGFRKKHLHKEEIHERNTKAEF